MIENDIDTETMIMEEMANEMGLEVCDINVDDGTVWIRFVGTTLVGILYRNGGVWEYGVRVDAGPDYNYITYQDVVVMLSYVKKNHHDR